MRSRVSGQLRGLPWGLLGRRGLAEAPRPWQSGGRGGRCCGRAPLPSQLRPLRWTVHRGEQCSVSPGQG